MIMSKKKTQDEAMASAFVEGTLPEEDRRAPDPNELPVETELVVPDSERVNKPRPEAGPFQGRTTEEIFGASRVAELLDIAEHDTGYARTAAFKELRALVS